MPQPMHQPFQPQSMPASRAFEEACLTYFQALQGAGVPADTQRAIMDAHGLYVAALQQPWSSEEVRRKATAAYALYAGALRSAFAPEMLRRHASDAYRRYTNAVREAWMRLDPSAVTAEDLMAIGQTMIVVAGIAAITEHGAASNAGPVATAAETP